ncbi:TetR family transcriptional regulator [Paenibacillus swuensis]|uniref:TetR family transcriptional regulator n=1 Tax=Paenibacillus swuensis TaxID=1178515 RepID=A0A172TGD8_9BACL|nr:TetR-like C-terminal domain-containing protein [Paenibacillus swuensis]ANE46125.1 TetR family transcriptional regulator [Paenibacillus swuensis]
MSPRAGLDAKAVIAAAGALADEHGLEAVTLAMLAAKLSVRSPSLYNHIQGLTDLRIQLAVYGLEMLHGALASAVTELTGDEAVHALAQAYVDFARAYPGIYEASQRYHDQKNEAIREGATLTFILVSNLLSASYALEGDAAVHAMRGFRSVLHGFSDLERGGGFGIAIDMNASLRVIVDAFIVGMKTLLKEAK